METTTTLHEADILSERLPALRARIEAFAKRAAKLGRPGLTLTVGARVVRYVTLPETAEFQARRVPVEYVHVTVEGERPVLAGWEFVAAKEIQGNGESLFRGMPGAAIPARFQALAYDCEHCRLNRDRHSVLILRHGATGEHKQVGTTCLADFLAVSTVESYLAYCTALNLCLCSLDDEADADYTPDGGAGQVVNPLRFFAAVATTIRLHGWVSSAAAHNDGQRQSTAASVMFTMLGRGLDDATDRRRLFDAMTDDDRAVAETALSWARDQRPADIGYLYNLGVACRQDCVGYDNAGLVASAIMAYRKQQERAAAALAKPAGAHVGKVGERSVFRDLTVTARQEFESQFVRGGVTTLIKFTDPDGNLLVWFASGSPDYQQGDKVSLKATVKAHDAFRGQPQTVLTRATMIEEPATATA